jgi:hypothetical protein
MRNKTGLRRMRDVVTLTEIHCSGSAHDGCQAECQILWKDAWLRRLPDRPRVSATQGPDAPAAIAGPGAGPETGDRTYFCQMTALWEASHLSIDVGRIFDHCSPEILACFNRPSDPHFSLRRISGGQDNLTCRLPVRDRPTADLHLEAGDAVVVRSKDEIARTLVNGRNKGLWFDRDMIRFCGRPAIVRRRVNRIIHEATGKMVVMKTPCLTLEGVLATGEFLRLCPTRVYFGVKSGTRSPTDLNRT